MQTSEYCILLHPICNVVPCNHLYCSPSMTAAGAMCMWKGTGTNRETAEHQNTPCTHGRHDAAQQCRAKDHQMCVLIIKCSRCTLQTR
jgi:hypothetical protein